MAYVAGIEAMVEGGSLFLTLSTVSLTLTTSHIRLLSHSLLIQPLRLLRPFPPLSKNSPSGHINSISGATASLAAPPTDPTNQLNPSHRIRDIGKYHVSPRPPSPPPILRSTLPTLNPHPPDSLNSSHISIVDRVASALDSGDSGDMEEDCSEDEDPSDEDEVDTSDDEGLDDSMTLNQYQEEARRDALIRKSINVAKVSPKKGRMEAGCSHT